MNFARSNWFSIISKKRCKKREFKNKKNNKNILQYLSEGQQRNNPKRDIATYLATTHIYKRTHKQQDDDEDEESGSKSRELVWL